MKLRFLDVPIHDTGLILVLLSDGTLMIERSVSFVATYDYNPKGVTGCFDADGFSLLRLVGEGFTMEQEYDYGVAYPYKEMPTLKQWLIEQNLELKE